ncbi:MAG: glycerophosphodiester phosphodiesterase [Actinomycetota bacterium]
MVRRRITSAEYPLVVAHRGESADHPENTLVAFEAAIAAGADGVELDVRLTADGVAVVLHDAETGVVTDGSGPVSGMRLGELKRLRVRGEEVPTLDEALGVLSGRATADLEIKNLPGEDDFDSPREAVVEAVAASLERVGFEGPVLVSSFNWLSIERARELLPEALTGFLTIGAIDPRAALVYARSRGHDYVLPHAEALLAAGEAFVVEVHRAGLRVGTWTVDEEDRLATLFGWGVDAVATNVPALGVKVRQGLVRG